MERYKKHGLGPQIHGTTLVRALGETMRGDVALFGWVMAVT